MTESDKGFFKIEIQDLEGRAFDIIEAKDKNKYICGRTGQSFIIEIRQNVYKPKHTFGCQLFIDDEKVNGYKTFKYNAHYYGFKIP